MFVHLGSFEKAGSSVLGCRVGGRRLQVDLLKQSHKRYLPQSQLLFVRCLALLKVGSRTVVCELESPAFKSRAQKGAAQLQKNRVVGTKPLRGINAGAFKHADFLVHQRRHPVGRILCKSSNLQARLIREPDNDVDTSGCGGVIANRSAGATELSLDLGRLGRLDLLTLYFDDVSVLDDVGAAPSRPAFDTKRADISGFWDTAAWGGSDWLKCGI